VSIDSARPRPRYRDLPDGDARGVFGPSDRLGCLNLLTDERTRAAASLIRTGETFSLNGSIVDWPNPSPAGRDVRPRPRHHVYELVPGIVFDDFIDGHYLQSGSQWDGFLHVRDPASGAWYNGNADPAQGIESWASRGIAGRGALLDLARWSEKTGDPVDWRARREFSAADLEACAAAQGLRIEPGTILLVRVGWEQGYARLTAQERIEHAPEDPRDRSPVPGLAPSDAIAELLWDWGVAAIACDNPSLEVTPYRVDLRDSLHMLLLARLGMPIGELWLLDRLAAACDAGSRHEFFVASAPLHLPGGVGSPANAIAIL
jgi:kynurenine formamidase